MTGFRYLTADYSVQSSRFGRNPLTVTSNFGAPAYRRVPAGCVTASAAAGLKEQLCPAQR
jgi:hypothetical protein